MPFQLTFNDVKLMGVITELLIFLKWLIRCVDAKNNHSENFLMSHFKISRIYF